MSRHCWIVACIGLLAAGCHAQKEPAKAPAAASAVLGWDANSDFKAAGLAPEDFLKGSYPLEGDAGARAAWIGRSASVVFTAPAAGRNLIVSGWAPYSLHRKTGLRDPLVVAIRVNGVDVATRAFTSDALFEIRVPRANFEKALSGGPTTSVEIVTSHGIVPSRTLGGADARELSIKITRVVLAN